MKKIAIQYKDFGWFGEEPITVQRFAPIWAGVFNKKGHGFEEVLIWCNHAQTEVEEIENEISRIDQPDIVWTDSVTICLKCGAYKFDGDADWQDAPMGGVR